MKSKIIVFCCMVTALSGCAGMGYIKNEPMEFIYDFTVPETSKEELLNRARNHFAASYGDIREVFRVEDKKQGLMVGRGLAPWTLTFANECVIAYTIRYAAKEGKARVQYQLQEGVPAGSPCTGWPLPNQSGYKQIVSHLKTAANSLENALQGHGEAEDFMDF